MPSAPPSLPTGRVTFAFVDVVGSTRTFIEHGQAYAEALTALHRRIAHHTARWQGAVVETEGDGAFLAFHDAVSATEALIGLQEELETATQKRGPRLRVRAGAHCGAAEPVGGQYLALPVYVAARVAATAGAGQLFVTDALLQELVRDGWPRASEPVELGSYELKDIGEPVRLWRVVGGPAPPRATPARRTNVREPRTSFVGRSDELDRLRELVGTPGLVTVVGPGGSGKTRLASELALRAHGSLKGGAWLVELATLESSDQIIAATGAALGLTSAGVEQVVEVLRLRGRCVLVLDNCEHLIDLVCTLVETLLDACPDLTVLCTSREALHLAGERSWTLPPLPVDGAATQLFLDRATDAGIETPDLHLVHQLCAALDGLPLAIELAASQVRAAPLQEILAAVTGGTDALERRGGETRQRSLDAVLEWSLDRLPAKVRVSLLLLSVFPGRFGPDMARAVLTAAPRGEPEAVKVLAKASLVDVDGADYRLLWTIRDAARRQLDQDPPLKREAMDALATWAAAYGEERYRILTAHDDVAEDTLVAVELALDHALQVGTPGLGQAWHMFGVISATRGAGSSALELSRRAVHVAPVDADSVNTIAAGVNILEHHQQEEAIPPETFRAMKSLAADAGAPRLLMHVIHGEALREGNLGRWASSISLWHEGLTLAEDHPEARYQLPGFLLNLGYAYYYAGDRGKAIEYSLRALDAGAEQDLWLARATAHLHLADYALIEDRREDARDHALGALKESPPSFRFRAEALAYLARALARLGDPESALAAGREATEIFGARHLSPESMDELQVLLAELPELRDGAPVDPS